MIYGTIDGNQWYMVQLMVTNDIGYHWWQPMIYGTIDGNQWYTIDDNQWNMVQLMVTNDIPLMVTNDIWYN